MSFLKRHRLFLLFIIVFSICGVLVIRQYRVNRWKHVDLRENFILLHNENHPNADARLYQVLIQELPFLPDRELIADEQRLDLLFQPQKPSPDDLLWKYYVSVQNELQRRAPQRVARALKQAGSQ